MEQIRERLAKWTGLLALYGTRGKFPRPLAEAMLVELKSIVRDLEKKLAHPPAR